MSNFLKKGSLDDCCKKKICRETVFCIDDPCESPNSVFRPESCDCLPQCGFEGKFFGGEEGIEVILDYDVVPGTMLGVGYDMYVIPDALTVFGGASYRTGCVTGGDYVVLPLKPGRGQVGIGVTACGPRTAWEVRYYFICPDEDT